MKCQYACHSPEHEIARRDFLGGVIGGAGVLAGTVPAFADPEVSKKLAADQKRVLVVYMSGGLSQLESWDPKPSTDTGGPFRAIPTVVPGIHISELLPQTAQHMDKLSLIRSINTRNGDHGKGRYQMTRGRNQRPGDNEPHLGAVVAKSLEARDNPLPGHIKVPSASSGDGAYLGPRYASVGANGKPPANSALPGSLNDQTDQSRNAFRKRMNDRFLQRRRTAETDLYTYSYEQALDLMRRRDVFDLSKEPAKEQERYGDTDLGKHCLLARRLLERGVTYVQVSHSNYDTHNENFNFHLEQLGEFDQSFSTLIQDLHDRGMLESTLVVVMSEFGRTPRINARYGRDHWGNAWSICLGGAGVQPGAVIGKTNENGTKVVDREVDHGNLFHTYLSAVGIDSTGSFDIGGREFPVADPIQGADIGTVGMSESDPMPTGFDPKETHVTQQWKYTSPLIWCRFDPSGRYVFSTAEDNTVQRWEFDSGKLTTLEGHESWVRDLVFTPDGKTLITVGCDEQMIFWEVAAEAPKPIRSVKAHKGWIRCADVSPDGSLMATGGNDRLVKLWNPADGAVIHELAGHDSHVYSVAFHPSEPFVLSGDLSGQVKQWHRESGELVRTFDAKDLHSYNAGQRVHYGGVRSISISPDGKHLACSGLHKASNPLGAINEPLIVVFDWENQEKVQTHVVDGVRGVLWRMFYLADGTLFGASGGSGGGYLLFWKPGEEKGFHKFKLKDTIRGMDLHPDRLHVATTHWDRHLRISRLAKKAT